MLYFFSAVKYNTPINNLTRKERFIMKKLFVILLALCMTLSCFAGCAADADSDLAYVKDKGVLVVGITDYAPMDFLDENGEWTGFDAEFAQLVAAELGVEVQFQLIDWSKKFFELESKEIDAIWNGMTITDEVLLNTSCSDPYVVNAQVVVMNAAAAAGCTDVESLKGLVFAVEDESAGEGALTDAGIDGYTEVLDQATALMEVASGNADACVIDITMANAMTGEGSGYPDLAVAMSLTSEEYGIGFRKGSDLTAAVNEIMAELMASGALQALADKYSLTLAG